MNTEEYLQSKKIADRLVNIHNQYYVINQSTKKEDEPYKHKTALGLMFLNAYPQLRENNNNNSSYSYWEPVTVGSERMRVFSEFGDINNFWNERNYPVLEDLFGKEMAPLIKKAWDYIPSLPYQTGYSRRSFRAPQRPEQHFTRKLNFIISLNVRMEYNLTLKEYILYSNEVAAYNPDFGILLTPLVQEEDPELYPLLQDIVYNRHPTAKVSRPIIKAFLISNNPGAWKAIEDLLLSAQRQEGLRQTILEQLDETSIGALLHMMNVIVRENLIRFSSVVRAMDTWTGLSWEAEKQSTVKRFFELGLHYLEEPDDIKNAIKSKDNAEVYMALWAAAVRDVDRCTPLLQELLQQGNKEKSHLALYFINEVDLNHIISIATEALIKDKLKSDDSQEFLFWLIRLLNYRMIFVKNIMTPEDRQLIIQHLIAEVPNIPKKGTKFKGKVFSWSVFNLTQEQGYDFLIKLLDPTSQKDLELMTELLPNMPIESREKVASLILPEFYHYRSDKLKEDYKLSSFKRDFCLSVLKDRSSSIRSAAIKALNFAELSEDELIQFEDLLKSKSAEVRASIISFIMKKGDATVQQSIERLCFSSNQEQRLSALDMLNQLHKKEELRDWTSSKADEFAEKRDPSPKENILLENLRRNDSILNKYTSENGYGLFDPNNITTAQKPGAPKKEIEERFFNKNFGLSVTVDKLKEELRKLEALVKQHHDHEYTVTYWDGSRQTVLLGNYFSPISRDDKKKTPEERYNNYPLPEVWKEWMENSGLTNLDLFITSLFYSQIRYQYQNDSKYDVFPKSVQVLKNLTFDPNFSDRKKQGWREDTEFQIVRNLMKIYPFESKALYYKTFLEKFINEIPQEELTEYRTIKETYTSNLGTWRDLPTIASIFELYKNHADKMSDDEFKEYWQFEDWRLKTLPSNFPIYNYEATIDLFCRAYELDLITKDELLKRILKASGLRELTHSGYNYGRKKKENLFTKFPFLSDLLAPCIKLIVNVELQRGDSPTSVTDLAQNIDTLHGTDYLIRILLALGKDKLQRGYSYSYGSHLMSKQAILSKYLKGTYPKPEENQEFFNAKIKEGKISETRLVEAAMYAPQWLPFVMNHLGWTDMDSAVWWLHAHANQRHDSETETEIARFSKVDVAEFSDGAVDIDWFLSMYKSLGLSKWKIVYNAAKYISDGVGHKRAQLYADVILGNTKIREVTKRVKDKRNQDYLRVYGLVPLSKKNRDNDLLSRYKYLQQFKKESKQFGSQRQASEAHAVKIAMENLARTAGYSDPIRLTWVMETALAREIIDSSDTLTFDNVEIALEVNDQGKAEIKVTKDGKPLKSIPAKLRKNKDVIALKEHQKTLKEQYSRTLKSLEAAMVNRDNFTAKEVIEITNHPVLRPMLDKLVLKNGDTLGLLQDGKLVDIHGEQHELEGEVFIAHSYDLYKDKSWSDFQKYVFDNKLKQPFKQIFRELYLPTDDELKAVSVSQRYEGHQVQPKQTLALLKSRGWTVSYEEGLQKVFHKEGFIAKIYAMADWFSPADVESPTLETVEFLNRKTWKNIPFEEINGHIFSEVMRDLDLVVSVAHVGDVDPEASHSSMEMRSVLVKETARMFKLDNVEVQGNHVHITGELGEYNVHLGSAIVHKKPGHYIPILPVHSQHRGRLFLPFVDDDPKSAELMSKVLMLAKDNEIQDPTILSSIKGI
ncbi:DUF4132 domain-containing protein [Fulvivirga sediminis]|uniref:DUF4132 domain-containing protein n=1 Tax=Fulvivirga sediminis TaxID=2803949 RepID=A0A937F8X5_9BACT|nr:DUF4132 domain-containing protein [Fulvivirga sediminis]MBL3656148.1 DUF4132 domain-containing protein [Fulvivirga sediminis]